MGDSTPTGPTTPSLDIPPISVQPGDSGYSAPNTGKPPIPEDPGNLPETEEQRKKRLAEEAAQRDIESRLQLEKNKNADLLARAEGSKGRSRQSRLSGDSKAISVLSTLLTGPLGLTDEKAGAIKTLLGQ